MSTRLAAYDEMLELRQTHTPLLLYLLWVVVKSGMKRQASKLLETVLVMNSYLQR